MRLLREIKHGVLHVINENWTGRQFILPLAKTSIKKTNMESTLGPWWTLIRDFMYYIAFYFMTYFMMGGSADMDGIPKILFIAAGMVPFFIFTDIMGSGMNAIKKNKVIFTKMKFPITVIPIFECTGILINRIQSIALIFILCGLSEGFAYFNPLLFVYYTFALIALSYSFILLLSALGAVSKDFREVILSILRIFMFFVPIMWSLSLLENAPLIEAILKLNPIIYVMEGYRAAFSSGAGNTIQYAIYFWAITLIIFAIGSFLQYKLRRIYADVV